VENNGVSFYSRMPAEFTYRHQCRLNWYCVAASLNSNIAVSLSAVWRWWAMFL